MIYSVSNPDFPSYQIIKPQMSPAVSYYIRKLLTQNFDRLTSITADGAEIKVDLLSDLTAVVNQLYGAESRSVIDQLERLTLFHQTLSSKGIQHSQQIRESEQQIFRLLGYQLCESVQQGTILLVDDMPLDMKLLTAALTKHSYGVTSALEGATALRKARDEKPDLILLDIRLPGMDGYEVCKRLKADAVTRDIPVLFVSSVSDAQGKVKAFTVGAVDYITKPVQVEEMLARVEHQLHLRRLQQRLEEQNVRMQLEMQERQQSDERYRSIFENSIDGIFQSSPEGHYISVNPALARMYGYATVEELIVSISNIGEQLYADPGRRQGLQAYLQQQGQVAGAESRVHRKDGSKIWISENIRAVKDDDGSVIYYEGTVRDITERRRMESALRHQRKKTEGLLMSMLPPTVAERLKQDRGAIADSFDEVTVLFADIEEFTAFSSRITPIEQVSLLNKLFSLFDQLAEDYSVEKIKTIRDVYMVAGGVPIAKANHATAIADMALAMHQTAAEFQTKLGEPFQLRIGISTGSVVAGVIGKKKWTYDLWGNTVNLASRMQSQGAPGRTQVTAPTYNQLKERYTFEERGILDVYGIGKIATYWLTGLRAI
jgi:adenylate cyclase